MSDPTRGAGSCAQGQASRVALKQEALHPRPLSLCPLRRIGFRSHFNKAFYLFRTVVLFRGCFYPFLIHRFAGFARRFLIGIAELHNLCTVYIYKDNYKEPERKRALFFTRRLLITLSRPLSFTEILPGAHIFLRNAAARKKSKGRATMPEQKNRAGI